MVDAQVKRKAMAKDAFQNMKPVLSIRNTIMNATIRPNSVIGQDGLVTDAGSGNTACDPSNGACSGICDPQWFGPACQYDVSEFTVTGGSGSDLSWLTDNDDTTCNNGNVQSITVRLNTPHPLTWVRVVVRDTIYLNEFQLSYQTDGSQVSTPCVNPRSARVDDLTLDISCPTSDVVSEVTLSAPDELELCSFYISGGRNVALREATEQSSNFVNWYASKAVDGNPNNEGTRDSSQATCSHTQPWQSGLAWWKVTFSNHTEINKFVIHNRKGNSEYIE
ncbi:fucolectin-related molecule [Plakobranchus ocellatus]|uniref:Fucolectin-related molecule n=1 Tax=Plakobranchus ocellatus TaxID=259542 RepID=A0AAV4BGK9_9GAST|nr:fucolectin-related molecule [Plakobranchus ocellatus]